MRNRCRLLFDAVPSLDYVKIIFTAFIVKVEMTRNSVTINVRLRELGSSTTEISDLSIMSTSVDSVE